MSIAMLDVGESSLDRIRNVRRPTSARRVEANRRNASKSTGPKTVAGKRRASRNALKHGLCARLSHLPSECGATFNMFVDELEEELRPRTVMQRIVFNEIANLTWRLQRLPEAQSKLFAEESAKARADGDDEALSAAEVLARRFSDEPGSNGFGLMERYERGMRNSLLRLLRHFDQLKKHHPTTPYADDEPPCPPERAWSAADTQRQREAFEKPEIREAQGRGEPCVRPSVENEKAVEQKVRPCEADQGVVSADEVARDSKPSQSKPTEIPGIEAPAGKCADLDAAPVTKRSQRHGATMETRIFSATDGAPMTTNSSSSDSSVSIGAPSVACSAPVRSFAPVLQSPTPPPRRRTSCDERG